MKLHPVVTGPSLQIGKGKITAALLHYLFNFFYYYFIRPVHEINILA